MMPRSGSISNVITKVLQSCLSKQAVVTSLEGIIPRAGLVTLLIWNQTRRTCLAFRMGKIAVPSAVLLRNQKLT
jgi:hypothetical protein